MKWNNTTKEVISYVFALVSLIGGFGLTIAGFIVDPTGQIHESVLFVLGQCLVFAASICGISMHIRRGMNEISNHVKDEIKSHLDKENKEDTEQQED